MEEATDEEITHVCQRESEQISEALNSISCPRKPNNTTRLNTDTAKLDLSELVVLRSAHKMEQVRKGVWGSTTTREDTFETPSSLPQVTGLSHGGGARQEIVCKFYQLIRDADAEGRG